MAMSTQRLATRFGSKFLRKLTTPMTYPTYALHSHLPRRLKSAQAAATPISSTNAPPFTSFNESFWKLQESVAPTEQVMHEDRAAYEVCASDDFVKDYRELAKLQMWDEVFTENTPDNFHALDVCCGTGRWAHAFSDLVCEKRRLKEVHVDFLDFCKKSLTVLQKRASEMQNINMGNVHQHDLECGTHSLKTSSYDLVVNMHGLYGVPPKSLRAALTFMHDMIRDGGRLVIALGSEDSLYQRIPAKLHADGILDDRFTSVPQVLEACRELGFEVDQESLLYYEEFAAHDTKVVNRFVIDECVGNTFTSDGTPKFTKKQLWESLKPLVDSYLNVEQDKYKFTQDISVLTLRKQRN